ncbi:hypothetical protein KEM55_000544, partial [Ascosphaera atra]
MTCRADGACDCLSTAQIAPKFLKLEIVNEKELNILSSSGSAQNVLDTSNSTYHTEDEHCTIVLQHKGAHTFTLEGVRVKMAIKPPNASEASYGARQMRDFFTEGLIWCGLDLETMDSIAASKMFYNDTQDSSWPDCRKSSNDSQNGDEHERALYLLTPAADLPMHVDKDFHVTRAYHKPSASEEAGDDGPQTHPVDDRFGFDLTSVPLTRRVLGFMSGSSIFDTSERTA